MTILKHEIRMGRISLFIWSAVIACLLGICVLIYPEISNQMGEISEVFSNMGGFSAAFGMDRIHFGEFIGFFGVECGNILGLGGAFFSALLGISALAGEERDGTAEFLFTHPVSRGTVVAQKFASVLVQILIFNTVAIVTAVMSMFFIGESPDIKLFALMFAAYFIMQVETAAVCFGVSVWVGRGGFGMGLGLAAAFYFLNLLANLTEHAKFLKYITPFGYTDSAEIISGGRIEAPYLAAGLAITGIGIAAAFFGYGRKDIS